MQTECGEQEARQKRPDNADDDVADQPKAGSLNNQAGEPSGDRADEEDNE
jgi:hypothetical protein